ncbi:TetR/AcrR family transcriptional regulator (plasmid) [Cytobacillus spongiae]|uniref:TetR/AcrR family transcriptional regulator n=1 Tax=Cytobacillus spongiae TaxID=2901381 RepID=UPI00145CAC98|nr:TetR/AcrR family transcriptional regulator [Cytobacillus spongiae]NMH70958.1 TetR/AcrR family transcriptional regulator [Bacillus sp. RO3]UII58240.1 TetR/AcrR family transcriptional regulator [Cytobacillus spongiae]
MFKTLNIDPEKEERIINAATQVFAKNGYQNASTNAIVKEAKISKGILFHYFKSKKDLYVSLYVHLTDLFTEKIYERMDWNERDLFILIRAVTMIKFDLFSVYPHLIHFLSSASLEEAPEVKDDIEKVKSKIVDDSFAKLFSNVDTTKFKDGIDVKRAIQVIYWTFEGIANQQQQKVKTISVEEIDQEEVIAEIDSYIELLKAAFYK